MCKDKKIVAVFDFNGTLIKKNTPFSFLRYAAGYKYYLYLIFSPIAILYYTHILSVYQIEWILCMLAIKGKSKKTLLDKGHRFNLEQLNASHVNAEALERLKWHQSQNHYCMLVTGSYDVFIREWGKNYHFDKIICTELDFDHQDIATGRIKGPSCLGKEKLRRVMEHIDIDNSIIYAYGDREEDKLLLDNATYAYFKSF